MKRRDFIKTSALAGAGALAVAGCSSMKKAAPYTGPGFDLHPFIKAHPEAVFIKLTSVESKTDSRAIHDTAFNLAKELFVQTTAGGYPNSTKIVCKPNWTCNPLVGGKAAPEQLGINTDKNFIEGFCQAVREKGPQQVYLHECACPGDWAVHGWPQMAQANNFILRDLTSRDLWEYKIGEDLHFVKVPNGVVFKEIAFQVPVNQPGTFLIDIAKFKAHGMGITASIKNLQGLSGKRFHEFCGGSNSIFKGYDKRYHPYFHTDYMEHVKALTDKHVKAGIPRWDKPGEKNYLTGFYMEQWVQRMLDSLSVTKTNLCMVEGIYGRDGDGFAGGPHDGKAQDYISNNVIFGLDPFRVDIITHWLAGHEPGNFGLFHIGIERGMSKVLDPNDIPLYLWDEGKATLRKLDTFKRTDLVTYYMQRNYNGVAEPRFHLCNEPFDYSAWKSGKKMTDARPSVNDLGTDAFGKRVMEVSLPEKEDVYVDVLNRNGEVVWRLVADGLEPGVHQVVWDGFGKPGIYTVYVKGMGWDVARQAATYS
ncbi:MAG: DUF362 domain-containing protein [Candidatus Latescibacter sp.]|nr:DUF362 domain-containing protein [Candidatus Latescibacter sp.]